MAVQEDTTAGRPWPAEGWAAVAAAAGVAVYGVVAPGGRSKSSRRAGSDPQTGTG